MTISWASGRCVSRTVAPAGSVNVKSSAVYRLGPVARTGIGPRPHPRAITETRYRERVRITRRVFSADGAKTRKRRRQQSRSTRRPSDMSPESIVAASRPNRSRPSRDQGPATNDRGEWFHGARSLRRPARARAKNHAPMTNPLADTTLNRVHHVTPPSDSASNETLRISMKTSTNTMTRAFVSLMPVGWPPGGCVTLRLGIGHRTRPQRRVQDLARRRSGNPALSQSHVGTAQNRPDHCARRSSGRHSD